jgi:hypothetical protein
MMRSTSPLGASVFLFSATTLFHQGWDIGISENRSTGEAFYAVVIAMWLIAALLFSGLALFAANAIGRATTRVLREIRLGHWLLVGFSWLAAITAWGFISWIASLARNLIDDHTRQWQFIWEWLHAVVQLFGFFVVFWLVAVALCSIVAVTYAAAWGLVNLGRAGARVLSQLGRIIMCWPERAFAFIGFLEGLSIDIVERGIRHLKDASVTGLRWVIDPRGGFWRGRRRTRGRAGPRIDGWDVREGGAPTAGEMGRRIGIPVTTSVPVVPLRVTSSPPRIVPTEPGIGGPDASIVGPWNARTSLLWQRRVQFLWAHFLWFVSDLVAATRALGQWLSSASSMFKCIIFLLSLPAVPYSLVAPPVVPQSWDIPNELVYLPREAVTPSTTPAPKELKKPLLFARAQLVCPSHELLAWSYYDEDQLHFPITSCRFDEGSLAPCKAGAIVVVGRASAGGAEEAERKRSLERGRLLANVLKRDHLRQCGTDRGMRWFVLNLGQYAGDSLKGRRVAQREVTVFIADGDADLEGIENALEEFVGTQTILSEYTSCDLYALEKLPRKSSLVRRLRCGRSSK